ncbi:putative quinol monooxygenase [Streptomyces sp. MNU77]|uniref:putative quinol monooxygenase n=1 Tax=Streptomyces sp. MNU77 TaxID=1573406 RepID=UPI0015B94FAE|nr:putative quinol monooxygenase [Streptomyces sp. MNU77]
MAGTLTFPPERRDDFHAGFAPMRAATLAEPGCLEYAAYSDLESPGTFFVYERWADGSALAAHEASSHMKDFRATVRDLGVTAVLTRRFSCAPESTD